MRAVVQRVREAQVAVESEVVGAIGRGLCVLLGVGARDTEADAEALCRKIVALRIFEDDAAPLPHPGASWRVVRTTVRRTGALVREGGDGLPAGTTPGLDGS